MDEEYAQLIVDREEAGGDVAAGADPREISPLGYTPELSYLALIADRVLLTRDAVIAGAGEDPPTFQPLPRPVTAVDRKRESFARNELLEVDRLLRGGGLPMT